MMRSVGESCICLWLQLFGDGLVVVPANNAQRRSRRACASAVSTASTSRAGRGEACADEDDVWRARDPGRGGVDANVCTVVPVSAGRVARVL